VVSGGGGGGGGGGVTAVVERKGEKPDAEKIFYIVGYLLRVVKGRRRGDTHRRAECIGGEVLYSCGVPICSIYSDRAESED